MHLKTKRYYSSEEDFRQFYLNLKQLPCPHCKLTGALILHGYLCGYDEKAFNKRVIRGKRIFCNNRKKHGTGCGRTFSVLAVSMLKKFCISANSFWSFLKNVIKLANKIEALRTLKLPLSNSSAYRLWKRFSHAQSRIRSYLTRHCPKPKLPITSCPATETIVHLESVFNDSSCAISAFQERFQVSFL